MWYISSAILSAIIPLFLSARVCGSQVPDIGGQSITGLVLLTLHDGDAVDSAFSRKLEEIFLIYILAHCACHVFLLPATGVCAVGIQIVATLSQEVPSIQAFFDYRWLVSVGEIDKALEILKNVIEVNKKQVSKEILISSRRAARSSTRRSSMDAILQCFPYLRGSGWPDIWSWWFSSGCPSHWCTMDMFERLVSWTVRIYFCSLPSPVPLSCRVISWWSLLWIALDVDGAPFLHFVEWSV